MHVKHLFATFAADWSPFGTALLVSLALGTFAALSVCRLSPLPIRVQRAILLALPGVTALGCWLTRWLNSSPASFLGWYFYKFYFAELDAAFVVCVAFGAAFTIDAVRSSDRACRITGWCFAPVYVTLFGAALWYINGGFGWFRE